MNLNGSQVSLTFLEASSISNLSCMGSRSFYSTTSGKLNKRTIPILIDNLFELDRSADGMDNGISCHKSPIYDVAGLVGIDSGDCNFHRHFILYAQAHDGPYGYGWRWRLWRHAGHRRRNQLRMHSMRPQIQRRGVSALRKQNAQGRLLTHDS
jgi:hypothetical protein